MDDNNGYAVFFYPKAVEALGDGIKPYLQQGKGGAHIVCRTVDTGGALIGMTLQARTAAGDSVQLELMVPTSMVMMIVSARSEESFGFGPRIAVEAVVAGAGGGSAVQAEAAAVAKASTSKATKSRSKVAKPASAGAAKPKQAKSKPATPKSPRSAGSAKSAKSAKTTPAKAAKTAKPAKTDSTRKRSQT